MARGGIKRRLATLEVELKLDNKVYKQQLSEDLTSTKTTAKGMETAWQVLGTRSDAIFQKQRKAYQNALTLIKQAHESTAKDILRAEKALRNKLEILDREQYGVQKSRLQKLSTGWINMASKIYIVERAMWTIIGVSKFISRPFEAGFKAVEDYKQSVASLAAMVVTFSQRKPGESMAEQWERALGYSKAMVPILENIAAETLLSGQQTTALANALARSGVFLQANNKAQIEGFKRLANALPLMTKGQDIMRQINTEIRALFTGQGAASSMLLQTLKSIDPYIKKDLEIWRAQGTVMEHVGELLAGFGPATELLANTWQTVKSTIQTTVDQTLRDGMEPTYRVIISYVKELNQYLLKNKKIIGYEIANTLEKTRKALEGMVAIYRGLPEGIVGGTGIGIVGSIIGAKLLGSPYLGVIAGSLYLLNEQLTRFKLNIGSIPSKSAGLSEAIGNIFDAITGKRDWRTGAFKHQSDIFKLFHDSAVYGMGSVIDYANYTFEPNMQASWNKMAEAAKKAYEADKEAYLQAELSKAKFEEEDAKRRKKLQAKIAKEKAENARLLLEAELGDYQRITEANDRLVAESAKKAAEEKAKNAKLALKAELEAYQRITEANDKMVAEMAKNDLAYWVGVVNNANSTEDKLREAWQHINAIAKQNNIDAVQAFELGWKDATTQFKTVSMTWLEVGRDVAKTLQEDFSGLFLDVFEGKLNSFKDFWKGLWSDVKHIFLKAIADMLANKLVKEFFGLLGGKININFGKLTGGGALSTAASGASLAGLIKKVPGASSVLSKIPGVSGLLGLGGTAATGAVGAGAGVTGGASLALGGGTTAAGATAAGLGTAGSLALGAALPLGLATLGFSGGLSKLFGHHHKSWAEKVREQYERFASMDLMSMLDEMTKIYPAVPARIEEGAQGIYEKVEGRPAGPGRLWDISGVQAFAEKISKLGPLYQNLANQAAAFGREQNNQRISYKEDMDAAMNFSRALIDQINLLRGATGAGGALRDRLIKLKANVDDVANAARKNFAQGIREAIDALTKHTGWTRKSSDAYRELGLAGKTVSEQLQILRDELNRLSKVDPTIDISLRGHIDKTAQKIVGEEGIRGLYHSLLGREADKAGLTYWTHTGLSLDQIADLFKKTPEYRSRHHHSGYNVPDWIPKHHSGYYPGSGEHLAVIRNDETVLTPRQVQTVEKSIGSTINVNGPLVTVTGDVITDDAQIEKLARRIRTELTYLEELRQ